MHCSNFNAARFRKFRPAKKYAIKKTPRNLSKRAFCFISGKVLFCCTIKKSAGKYLYIYQIKILRHVYSNRKSFIQTPALSEGSFIYCKAMEVISLTSSAFFGKMRAIGIDTFCHVVGDVSTDSPEIKPPLDMTRVCEPPFLPSAPTTPSDIWKGCRRYSCCQKYPRRR